MGNKLTHDKVGTCPFVFFIFADKSLFRSTKKSFFYMLATVKDLRLYRQSLFFTNHFHISPCSCQNKLLDMPPLCFMHSYLRASAHAVTFVWNALRHPIPTNPVFSLPQQPHPTAKVVHDNFLCLNLTYSSKSSSNITSSMKLLWKLLCYQ